MTSTGKAAQCPAGAAKWLPMGPTCFWIRLCLGLYMLESSGSFTFNFQFLASVEEQEPLGTHGRGDAVWQSG